MEHDAERNPVGVPPLSTTSNEAAISYRDGIAALVSGMANAERLLTSATRLDPGFVIAHVGLAVCRVAGGGRFHSPALPASVIGRGERQHAEIVETTFRAEYRHAADLRREHLLEYPADLLIVWLAGADLGAQRPRFGTVCAQIDG